MPLPSLLVPQPGIKPDSLPYKADSFLKNNFMYLFLAVLGLRCCTGFFLVAESWEHSLGAVQGLLNVVDCLVAEHSFQGMRISAVAVRGNNSVVGPPRL